VAVAVRYLTVELAEEAEVRVVEAQEEMALMEQQEP
jgi:hypothetical protein